MFTWIVIGPTQQRNAVIPKFLLGGNLEYVEHMSDDSFKDACTSYVKRTDGTFLHIL